MPALAGLLAGDLLKSFSSLIKAYAWPEGSGKVFFKKAGQISIGQILPQLTEGDSFQKLLPFIDAKLDEFLKKD